MNPVCDYFDGSRKCDADCVPGLEHCAKHGLALAIYWLGKDLGETRPQYAPDAEEITAMIAEGDMYLDALREKWATGSDFYQNMQAQWRAAVAEAQPVIERLNRAEAA